ncbi:MAG: hypothetical protein ACYTF9_16605 [Planctomycetota bacterium]|jgi:hypothetical protein
MTSILVVYAHKTFKMRESIRSHLYCFRETFGHQCSYLNVAVRSVPRHIDRAQFDLIIFHTTLLSIRWNPPAFRRLLDRLAPFAKTDAVKAAVPQDEFYQADLLEEFFGRMNVSDNDDRPIDVGYRAWHAPPWLGRHGRQKVAVAEAFAEAATRRNLRADISTSEADTLYAAQWLAFLGRCRFTIGTEGGASIIDRDGAFRERTEAYLGAHPDASFEEVEEHCFPEAEGSLALHAISPRHFEACATRTCQVLVDGEYNGVLEADRHYIALRPDFSNIEAVLDAMNDDELRQRLTDQAYEDVILSGRYTADRFARQVVEASLEGRPTSNVQRRGGAIRRSWLRLTDRPSWALVLMRQVVVPIVKRFGVAPTRR